MGADFFLGDDFLLSRFDSSESIPSFFLREEDEGRDGAAGELSLGLERLLDRLLERFFEEEESWPDSGCSGSVSAALAAASFAFSAALSASDAFAAAGTGTAFSMIVFSTITFCGWAGASGLLTTM